MLVQKIGNLFTEGRGGGKSYLTNRTKHGERMLDERFKMSENAQIGV